MIRDQKGSIKKLLMILGIIGVFVLILLFVLITYSGGERALKNNYLLQIQDLNEETGRVIMEYSSTSKKLSEHTITSSQAVENYKTYKEEFQNIKNEMVSISPVEDLEEAHQHYLTALDLLIEACEFIINGIDENNIVYLNLAKDSLNKALIEIKTFTEIVKNN